MGYFNRFIIDLVNIAYLELDTEDVTVFIAKLLTFKRYN